MFHPYRIFVDATADFPARLRARVDLLPMQISFGDEHLTYAADWDEAQTDAFYARLKNGEMPVTSQISPFAYERAFENALEAGQDALYLCFSSGLSGTIASAHLAARALHEKYPERTVAVFDTRSATFALGILVGLALENRDAGLDIAQNISRLEAARPSLSCRFTVSDLMYLKHGGRISPIAAAVGATLRIMPMLAIDPAGKLPVIDRVQGRKAAIRALVRNFQATVDCPERQTLYVIHAQALREAQLMEEMARQAAPALGGTHIATITPIVGAHTGPGLLALAFRAKLP